STTKHYHNLNRTAPHEPSILDTLFSDRLLAVFGDYVFIFFDRENQLPEVPEKDPQVLWDR
ncbi:MAG: hypothetical protein ACRERU_18630, partial [Methylococcales bacterium]